MKPRIVITVVTEHTKIESSIVKGRPMPGGGLSPGPTAKQFAIVRTAIRKLVEAEHTDLMREAEENDA